MKCTKNHSRLNKRQSYLHTTDRKYLWNMFIAITGLSSKKLNCSKHIEPVHESKYLICKFTPVYVK